MTEETTTRRYEVMARRQGRWTIDCLTPTQGSATARAEALYADDRVEAVKVVRARFSVTGDSWETPVFERVRPPAGRAPIMVAAGPEDAGWCETLDDFYGPDGRRAIARVLRNFLDRHTITPTELLHDPRYIRPLESQEGLLQSAVSRIAQQQATARGVPMKERRDLLHRFVEMTMRRSKAARAGGKMPVVDKGGLAGLVAAASRHPDPAERAFIVRYAASQRLFDASGFMGRLETVVGWAVPPLSPAMSAYVDELVSGLLGAATLVQEVIGLQARFGQALVAIAELATGRQDGSAPGGAPILESLGRLMMQDAMPESRLVLLERLQREIASDKPLGNDLPARQRQMFDRLTECLVDRRGLFHGGPPMVEALARRSRKLDIVGGIEPVRFNSTDTLARLEQLLALERETLAERPARALATYMADVLDRFDGDVPVLLPIRRRVEASRLPDDARQAVLDRLPKSG
jgi:hypothetical protein